jgi:ribosomal protein S7
VLLQVPAVPYNASEEVRQKFHELTIALFKQALAQADPDVEIGQIKTVPPGAAADTKVH